MVLGDDFKPLKEFKVSTVVSYSYMCLLAIYVFCLYLLNFKHEVTAICAPIPTPPPHIGKDLCEENDIKMKFFCNNSGISLPLMKILDVVLIHNVF